MTAVIGNIAQREAFFAGTRGGAFHPCWLIAGPQGIGKRRFAQDAAVQLLAQAMDPSLVIAADAPEPPGQTAALIRAGAHPDFYVLKRELRKTARTDDDLARNITVDQVRGFIQRLSTKPALSSRRVVIVDSVDDLERSSANTMLKSLEEPPAGTIFLMISHAPGRLLPTIRSRCQMLRFERLGDADTARVLRDQLPDAPDDEIATLVAAGEGCPGTAIAFAGLDLNGIERDLTAMADGGDRDNVLRARMARALGTKAAQERYEAFLARAPGFIARRARTRNGAGLREALDLYAAACDLARVAESRSLDPAGTVFEMGGLVARLGR